MLFAGLAWCVFGVGPARAATAPVGGLPDGRVYEQASPVDKNGGNAAGQVGFVAAASDGERATFFSNSPFPGSVGGQEWSTYVMSRGASSWAAAGLLLPAVAGEPSAAVIGWGSSLARSYVWRGEAFRAGTLFRRDDETGELTRITPEGIGTVASKTSLVGESAGGETVVFESTASLVGAATGNKSKLYAWDAATGELGLVGVSNSGAAFTKGVFGGPYEWFSATLTKGGSANGYPTESQHVVSADGSSVFFTEEASGALYVRQNPTSPQSSYSGEEDCAEPAAACTRRLSQPNTGVTDPNGQKPAAFVGATPDGSAAFFTSPGRLTADATTGPGDEGNDLYMYEAGAPEGERLTDLTPDIEPADPAGAEVRGVLGFSGDGSYVYFAANGVLAQGATKGDCAGQAFSGGFGFTGECNLYLWHEGSIDYIARLDTAGLVFESDAADWQPTLNTQPQKNEPTARVSADGSTLLFRSQLDQTAYASGGVPEFYRYHLGDGGSSLTCVSCRPDGTPSSSVPDLFSIRAFAVPTIRPSVTITRNLSADGSRVFFETADPLVPGDTNGVLDVYEWEEQGKGTCTEGDDAYSAQAGGCLYLISTGTSPDPSYLGDADEGGSNVFLFTSQQLVAQDRDQLVDVYDARVDGGIASQGESPPAPCAGEACAGSSRPSAPQTPSSTGTAGKGNSATGQCVAFGDRARQQQRRAAKLRGRAKKSGSPRRAASLRKKAGAASRSARRLSDQGTNCRNTNAGVQG